MLYVTTRSDRDPCTAYRAVNEGRGPDGGFYLPFRHPKFTPEEIEALAEKSFGQCVADVLNRLCNSRLSGWDIDFYCGRNPVRLHSLGHKVLAAEAWHTPTGRFDQLAREVTERICGEGAPVSDWMNIAVRAAVWFGVFGELQRSGITRADVSVLSGAFSLPISAWYARHWGLPIGNIICCCNENNAVWELLCYGQMRTDGVSTNTILPRADISLPVSLERLIYEAGGISETARHLECCRRGIPYYPGDRILSKIRTGLYASVVSSSRIRTMIPSVYRSNGYLMAPETAFVYAGAQDYRARTGQTCAVILWSEERPEESSGLLSLTAESGEEAL